MPQGPGTYGGKRGRPPGKKKGKGKPSLSTAQWRANLEGSVKRAKELNLKKGKKKKSIVKGYTPKPMKIPKKPSLSKAQMDKKKMKKLLSRKPINKQRGMPKSYLEKRRIQRLWELMPKKNKYKVGE